MNKRQILASLNKIANELDNNRLYKEANSVTNIMMKLAADFDPDYDMGMDLNSEKEMMEFNKYQNDPGSLKNYNTDDFQVIFTDGLKNQGMFSGKNGGSGSGEDFGPLPLSDFYTLPTFNILSLGNYLERTNIRPQFYESSIHHAGWTDSMMIDENEKIIYIAINNSKKVMKTIPTGNKGANRPRYKDVPRVEYIPFEDIVGPYLKD